MATATAQDTTAVTVAAWVPATIAAELRTRASSEGRSVSAEIRQALNEHLADQRASRA